MSFVSSQLSPASSASANGFVPGVSASEFASKVGSHLINRYGPSVARAAQTKLDNTVTNVLNSIGAKDTNSTNNNNKSNKGDSPANKPPEPPKKDSGWRSNKKKNAGNSGGASDSDGIPKFTIDSGIESGVILNPLQPNTEYYSSMYIQCGCLFPQDNKQSDSELSNLLNKQLYYQYLVIIQSQVNFSMSNQFTEFKFFDFINKISYALQLYYMVDSILAYTSHTPNTNLGMVTLRMLITPDISNGHIKLKEMLESTPIPPNLLEYIRFMYQNYSFNNVKGSSIIRLSLADSLCVSEYDSLGIDGNTYGNVIDDLINISFTSAIIKKIKPDWVDSMKPSTYEVVYNPQFSTFWHNSNIAFEDYGSSIVKHTINSKSDYDPLYYGIFDNRLDGLIYASCSVSDQNDVIQKGLWKPFSDFANKNSINSSLLHFSNDRSIRPVTDVAYRNASMVFSAPYTVITKDGNPTWIITSSNFAGSTIPQTHTLANVVQAVTRSVNWLFSPG